MSASFSRGQAVARLVGIVLVGIGAVGVVIAHGWIGPKVGRAARQIYAGLLKTQALLIEWKGQVAEIEPILAQAGDAVAHGRDLAAEAAEALGSIEGSHRSLAHALLVASQDLGRLPAAALFRDTSASLTDSADRVSRLAFGLRAQRDRVATLADRVPDLRKALVQAHTTADTLSNRVSKARGLMARTHVYRVFLVVADGASLVLILLGMGLFALATLGQKRIGITTDLPRQPVSPPASG